MVELTFPRTTVVSLNVIDRLIFLVAPFYYIDNKILFVWGQKVNKFTRHPNQALYVNNL